ncbi:spermidine synthase [Thermosporothrix hazakensis]|uniref:Spermidine synthase n=2 Tax=Thermosporothrix TaxID=768650 RepID=A0A326U9Z6_THEHA|nr:fused MFS/spermidine synthase [Thermosporothrix hazakensis]PZW31954.1 spermidine synthase [Thermosporothrix hazakensis]BBH91575.1 spermidine synthase [Thermosporothrix sp. COM3]GCE49721.1 spermidine synthase [Thermosporothrix hazakensis]
MKRKHIYLLILVFIGGLNSLAIEMCAQRLLGAYFGSSLYIWAVLIGLILIYLTVGYYIGGKLADRYPSEKALCLSTAISALFITLIPFVSQSVLSWSIDAIAHISVGAFLGSLLGTVLLFAVPVILLGLVSPFAIRLVTQELDRSGRISGSLYAISTAGSILGAFLPVLWMIPTFGVRRSLLILGALLFLASLWGLRPYWRFAVVIPLIAVVLPLGPLKEIPNLIYYQESYYNYIQVTKEADGSHRLILNEGQAIHSIYYPDLKQQPLTGWYWDYFLAAPYFNKGFKPEQLKRVAIVGLAGGTIAKQITQVYGPVAIDGIEIDPAIVEVGRKYFDMNEKNLTVYEQDGRAFFSTTQAKYDLVVIDAFQQPYIPFQLTTKEFFEEIKAHLTPTGVVAINTGHTETDYRLVQAFVNTMSTVYPSVHTFDVPNTINTEVMATMQPTSSDTFRVNMAQFDRSTTMGIVASEMLPAMKERAPDGGLVFTDDRAPIEQITDQLLLNYIQGP